MAEIYERECPVCGELFITKHKSKRFCCAECVAEYDEIKRYMYKRVKGIVHNIIEQARTTDKTEEQLFKEFMRRW